MLVAVVLLVMLLRRSVVSCMRVFRFWICLSGHNTCLLDDSFIFFCKLKSICSSVQYLAPFLFLFKHRLVSSGVENGVWSARDYSVTVPH